RNIASSFEPTLWRAMIENEGIKKQLGQLNDKNAPWCFAGKPTRDWLNKGLAELQAEKAEGDGNSALFRLGKFGNCKLSYSDAQAPDGSKAVKLEALFSLTDVVSEYPRVGLTVNVPVSYGRVCWYGNGPQECYCDRNYAALRGMYAMDARDLEVRYVVPQENGSRDGVYYLELDADDGRKLHFQSAEPFSFNYSPYSVTDLFKCHHRNELVDLTKGEGGHWILTLDAAHRGVGTGACGPDTMEPYRIRPGVYSLSLIIW
ncbi:MAG: glycoside hydrolase family 2, partial [Treponema sp.]|nr:glycoside hydrolase family 2 [Treponema sp.]